MTENPMHELLSVIAKMSSLEIAGNSLVKYHRRDMPE
jgi:hypothetical protein